MAALDRGERYIVPTVEVRGFQTPPWNTPGRDSSLAAAFKITQTINMLCYVISGVASGLEHFEFIPSRWFQPISESQNRDKLGQPDRCFIHHQSQHDFSISYSESDTESPFWASERSSWQDTDLLWVVFHRGTASECGGTRSTPTSPSMTPDALSLDQGWTHHRRNRIDLSPLKNNVSFEPNVMQLCNCVRGPFWDVT